MTTPMSEFSFKCSFPIPLRAKGLAGHSSLRVLASRVGTLLCGTTLLGMLVGCGGGGSSGEGVITSVNVAGPSFSQAGVCQEFTANVNGSGNYDHSVTWYVNERAGGTQSDGSINSFGNYCAPAQPPTNNPVSIKAVANGNSSKFGTTTTRVLAVSITPTMVHMHVGDTQQFSATISGGLTNAVQWMVSGIAGGNSTVGTTSSDGLYTAPAHVTDQAIMVEAASGEAPSIAADADLWVMGRILIAPPNTQLLYGTQQQLTATLVGSNDTQIFWAATYGSISPTGLYTATGDQTPDTIRTWSATADGETTVQVLGHSPRARR
jgi:hypothetical protein